MQNRINSIARDNLSVAFLASIIAPSLLLPLVKVIAATFLQDLELSDKLVYLGLLGLVAYGLTKVYFTEKNGSFPLDTRAALFEAFTSIIVLYCSVSIISELTDFKNLWYGYGIKIASLGIIGSLAVYWLLHKAGKTISRVLGFISIIGFCFVYIPSGMQTANSLIDTYHSAYVINEVLAPSNGSYPLSNFVSQYTSLLGYLFAVIFRNAASFDNAVLFLSGLALLTVALYILSIARALPKRIKYFSILLFIPGVLITKQPEDTYSSSIFVLFSSVPVRHFFAPLIALALTANLSTIRSIRNSAIIGSLCGFAIVNNFESGIVYLIASITVLVFEEDSFERAARNSLIHLIAAVFSMALFLIYVYAISGSVHLVYLVKFAGGFGTGFGALPMPDFGLWVFVFSYLAASTVTGLTFIRKNCTGVVLQDNALRPKYRNEPSMAHLASFYALSGLGMLPYYINRSSNFGQLQHILVYLFAAVVPMSVLVCSNLRRSGANTPSIQKYLITGLALFPLGVSLSSLISMPSLRLAYQRIINSNHTAEIYASMGAVIVNDFKSRPGNQDLKFAGTIMDFGNVISSFSGTTNLLPANNRSDIEIFKLPDYDICQAVIERNISILYVHSQVGIDSNKLSSCTQRIGTIGTEPIAFSVYNRRSSDSKQSGLD